MDRFDKLYMKIAQDISLMSHCNRKKVGAVLIKDNNIISFGWNGTPFGYDNECEDEEGNTKPELIHSEVNVIAKAAASTISTFSSTLYVTLSPCYECAKLLIQSKIKKIIYLEEYRIPAPINFLRKCGIECVKYEENN